MTKETCCGGCNRKRTSWARLPRSTSGASVRSHRPSARSSRFPASTLARMSASTLAPDLDHVIEGVALHRDLARVADDAEDLLPGEASGAGRLRRVGDLLVLQGAVDVGGAEVQGDRGRLLADHHPVRLDVGEVVEQESRGGDGAEIVRGRRLARYQLGVADLVGEGNEREEASARVLLLAQTHEMLDPLCHGLDVAVEHGGVGLDAQGMRDAVDLQPAVGVGLAREAQLLLHALRVKTGLLEARQGLPRLDLPATPEVVDLRRREGLDLRLRPGGVDGRDHPLEVLEGPVGVVPAHDVGLPRARLDHLEHVLDGVLEGPCLSLLAREVAEGAGEDAEIGRVDVAVEHEEDLVAVEPGLGEVGQATKAVEILGLEEELAVLTTEPLTGAHLVPERMETGIAEGEGSDVDCRHRRLRGESRPTGRSEFYGRPRTLSSIVNASGYLMAPTVKPAMKRSRKKLYMIARGMLVIRQAAIREPQ